MTGSSRFFFFPASWDAPSRSAALFVFLLALVLIHPSAPQRCVNPDEGLGPDRVSAAQTAAPMDRDVEPEKRLDDAPPTNAAFPDPRVDEPLSSGAGFLKFPSANKDRDLRAQEAFNRLLVRILSPLSRRSWG